MTDRSFVFLNHAITEENAFTAWLGARLAAAGYDVWSESLMLGDETFWADINEGIRRRGALFVPTFSSAAAQPEKLGVQNEITIAMQVQRWEKRDNGRSAVAGRPASHDLGRRAAAEVGPAP